jgi:hypothetical protein
VVPSDGSSLHLTIVRLYCTCAAMSLLNGVEVIEGMYGEMIPYQYPRLSTMENVESWQLKCKLEI